MITGDLWRRRCPRHFPAESPRRIELRALPCALYGTASDARFRRNLAQHRSHQGGRVKSILAEAITGVQSHRSSTDASEAALSSWRIHEQGEAGAHIRPAFRQSSGHRRDHPGRRSNL